MNFFKNMTLTVCGIMLAVFVFCIAQCSAQEKNAKKVVTSVREIEGEVSGIGYNAIAIIYNRNLQTGVEEEILLPYDAVTPVVNKKTVKDISIGDTVSIQIEESGEGDKVSRKAKQIRFVKPAQAELSTKENQ